MENNSSDRASDQEDRLLRVFLWDLNAELSRRFLAELKAEPGRLAALPPPERWEELRQGEPAGIVLSAEDPTSLPWGAIRALREMGAHLLLLLPDCDTRLWLRLTRLGFQNVLTPPFTGVDLDLELDDETRLLPLSRRLPELDARVRTQMEFRIPADLRFVAPSAGLLARMAREHAFPPRVWADSLPLAVDEALVNAIRHGCQEDPELEVTVQAWIQHDILKIRIEDPGPGYDPSDLPDPESEKGLLREGGRGVFLMHELMDRVQFEEGGSVVVLYARRRENEQAG